MPARASDPAVDTWYYKGWGVGGWVEECATNWGTKNGSWPYGAWTTVAWAQYSAGGTCNVNYTNIGASRINAGLQGYRTSDGLLRCSNLNWNPANQYYVTAHADCPADANQGRHSSIYTWPDPYQWLDSSVIFTP